MGTADDDPRLECPAPKELHAYIYGRELDGSIAIHLEECANCQVRLKGIASQLDSWFESVAAPDGSNLSDETQVFLDLLKRTANPVDNLISNSHGGRTEPNQNDELPIGDFDHFRIKSVLGEGGFGIVYLAEHTRLERLVALKFLKPRFIEDKACRQRFLDEAKAASNINFDRVVQIYDVGEVDLAQKEHPYIAMEFVSGFDLGNAEARKNLTIQQILQVMIDVARGMGEVHEQGFLHRDIKPSNILVDATTCRAKLTDFGLATMTERVSTSHTAGTLAYVSPERLNDDADVDQRSDIFSFGVVFYEALSGKRPFSGLGAVLMYNILKVDSSPVTALDNSIPNCVGKIVSKCLEKDPARRYRSAVELLHDLQSAELNTKRRRRLLTLGVILVLSLCSLLVVVKTLERDHDPSTTEGQTPTEFSHPSVEQAITAKIESLSVLKATPDFLTEHRKMDGFAINNRFDTFAESDDAGNIELRSTGGALVAKFPGSGSRAWRLRFSPNDRFLTALYREGKEVKDLFGIWDIDTKRAVELVPNGLSGLAFDFSRDGNSIIFANVSGEIRIIDLVRQTSVIQLKSVKNAEHLSLSPKGETIALCRSAELTQARSAK